MIIRLRRVGVFYAAIGLQLIAFPVHWLPWRTPDRIAVVLWLVSYALFAAGLLWNARVPGVPLVAAGLARRPLGAPDWVPWANVFSAGDVLIAAGGPSPSWRRRRSAAARA